MKSNAFVKRVASILILVAFLAFQLPMSAFAESDSTLTADLPSGYTTIKEVAGNTQMKALGESIRSGAEALVQTPQPEVTSGHIYYVSTSGDDANSGTSPSEPWKSIEKVNATTLQPGDMLLFHAGDKWELTTPVHPLGSGTEDAPIVIGAYGEGAKPCFDAKEVANDPNRVWNYGDVVKHSSDGLYLENQEYIEIRDLEIVNAPDGYDGGDSQAQQNLRDDRRGVHIAAVVGDSIKVLRGIRIHDMYIHDVTGDTMTATKWDSSKRTGGIVFETILKDETTGLPVIKDSLSDADLEGYQPAYFSDIVVENNVLMDNGFGSIIFKQLKKWGVRPNGDKTTAPQYYHTEEQGWYPHRNITIRNNYLDHDQYELGADTIYLTNSKDSIVEHNYCVGAGTSAIELNQTDNIIVQYNEVYRARRKATGADSNAIDPDRNATNILIQYNYIDSCGDGILLCGFNYGSSVVRYNVIKDSDSEKRYINIHGSKGHNYIYNNILYNSTSKSATFIASSGGSNYLNNSKNHHYIYNNIFYSPNAVARLDDGSALEYSNNSYYNVNAVPEEDTAAVLGEPNFQNISTLSGGPGNDVNVTGLMPSANSPLCSAGRIAEADGDGYYPNTIIPVASNGFITDLLGNTVTAESTLSIGPAEFVDSDATIGGINGVITDPYGLPKAGASVCASVGENQYTATSDAYGFYALYGLPIGSTAAITLHVDGYADTTDSVEITAGIARKNMQLGTPTTNNGTIKGTVTNAENVAVTLTDNSGAQIATTTTDSDGAYLFDEIPAGENYTITFSKEGYADRVVSSVVIRPAYVTVIPTVEMTIQKTDVTFLLKESFDTYDVGPFNGGETWNVYNSDSNENKVTIVEEDGNKYLSLQHTDDLGKAVTRIWNKEPLNATGKFSVAARIKSTDLSGDASRSRFGIFTTAEIGQNGDVTKPMADFGFYPQKLFVDDGTQQRPIIKYSSSYDTWYDIRLDVDMTTDTYDFYVDGVLRRANCGLRTAGDTLNYFCIWGTDKQRGNILIDYLWVYQGSPDAETVSLDSVSIDEMPSAAITVDEDTHVLTVDTALPYETEQATIRVKAANPLATVSIAGVSVGYADDNEPVVVSLQPGENEIPITVTAFGDAAATATYTLKLTRQDGSLLAYLTELTIDGIDLNPAFDGKNPSVDDVSYDGGVTTVATHTLTWSGVTSGMNVTAMLNGEAIGRGSSGEATFTLQPGSNTLVISTISASEDEFKTYTISIQYSAETETIATGETAASA